MILKFFIIISIIFSSTLYSTEIRDVVILEANEAPPFWSKKMPQDGMVGEIVHAISKAVEIDSKIVFKPLARMIADDENNDLGDPAFFIVNQDFAQIIPVALYHISLYYYAPNQKNRLQFNSIDELRGKKIGVLKSTLIDYSYFKQEGITFEESYSQESLFKKLKIGRLDMVIEIELVSQRIIYSLFPKEIDNFVKIPISKYSHPIAIMLTTDYPNVKDIANRYRKGLKKIIEDGTYKKILNRYYKEDIVLDLWLKDLKRFEKLYKIESGE